MQPKKGDRGQFLVMILMTDDNPNPLTNMYILTIIVKPFIMVDIEYEISKGNKPKEWTINPVIPDLSSEVLSMSDEGLIKIEFSDPLYPIPNL